MDNRDRKSHVHSFRLNMRPTEYEVHINRLSHPYVLTITKITEAWENAHRRWQRRASVAQEALQRLPQPTLKQCLAEKYEPTMDLHMLKVAYRSPSNNDPPEVWDIQRENLSKSKYKSGSDCEPDHPDLDSGDEDYEPDPDSEDEEYESDGDYEHDAEA